MSGYRIRARGRTEVTSGSASLWLLACSLSATVTSCICSLLVQHHTTTRLIMSWWAPSWLSLPSVDFSLPSGIQGRFISFILKRTLGHFLKPGQLDVQQIDSQIGSGYVQVRDLELDYDVCSTFTVNGFLFNCWQRLSMRCLQDSPSSCTMVPSHP